MGKKYDVYGVGNALVDIEYEVSPELLEKLNIDKGVMTLLDEDSQNLMLDNLKNLNCHKSCGGSAANTIVAISQLGGKTFYSCKVANDEFGEFYIQDLLNCQVDTNLKNADLQSGITGKCLVLVTPDADRTMNTFLGITGEFSSQELVPEAIADSEYLYIEGYLVTSPTGKAAAIQARDIAKNAGVKTTMSLSDYNMVKFFKDGLLDMIGPGLDFIFANESEALGLAETEDFQVAVDKLKILSQKFAITRGPKGSVVFDGEKLIEISAPQVHAVDTVGAGDMYAGAFLYGITHGMSYEAAGKLASTAASQVVTTYGPRLKVEDLQALLTV
ncbi:adenosine kinase [Sphaerospermopsis sp. FACHB-1094]|uniref:adenosine kinase n=1 Tax=Sphaerospermopsis sp. FACHB-1094 TaxID=2692861 RepID=UPI0016888181|nr:adenosine kinase [Sphaerospermopsis sp. FACHB-1094]MBD2133431.1 adenosine kinase [Sphaerospermopsis sp. FACHB-1094]